MLCCNILYYIGYVDILHILMILGAYAYIETSFPRKRGDVARLETKLQFATKRTCLTFFYHMLGRNDHMGTLNVYIKEHGLKKLIFTQTNSQGNKWIRKAINLRPNGAFTVIVYFIMYSTV